MSTPTTPTNRPAPAKAQRITKPKRRVKARKTKAQQMAGEYLDLAAIVHYLLTEQRCPILFEGKLAYVRCPGVSREAFKQAIDIRVSKNLLASIRRP